MRVLFLFLLLLVLKAGGSTLFPNCTEKCGDVSIPYPFGIGAGCFMPGFELTCKETDDGLDEPFTGNVEVISISLHSGQARIYNHVSTSCYNDTVTNDNWWLDFTKSPYRFSNTLNKFTTVGCESLAYINSSNYQSGCLSVCRSPQSLSNGTCSGMGCCQTSIPTGLNYYNVLFDPRFNNRYVRQFSPCSYAFLVEDGSYKFNVSHITTKVLSQENRARVPLVLDWAIGNISCDVARANRASYACLSEHSECVNSTNGPGYLCNCSSGYQGNPYLKHGCQDIDECKLKKEYPCYGRCINTAGNYSCDCFSGAQGNASVEGGCRCPSGTQGNPDVDGGCIPNPPSFRFPVWLILVIGIFCTFIATAFTYIVFEKVKLIRMKQKYVRMKQEYFRQNGGLLLEEKIKGAEFKIFTVEEMKSATKDFDKEHEIGKGGHGMVYKGRLDDNRIVAIKRSQITGKKQTEQFINEMSISYLLNHKNVVKILGCCLEVEVPLLVYEFMSKGTLFDYIHNKENKITRDFCLEVATGSAAALTYLHSYASPTILHCDVKSTNILLDDDLTPKLSDFGGSLRDDKESLYVHTTDGYRGPESSVTNRSDVYSFAAVLLELITRKTVPQSNEPGLVSRFKSSKEGDGSADVFDDEVKCEFQGTELEELTMLLKQCLCDEVENRPTMKEVATRLERLRELLPQVKCTDELREITLEESSSYQAEDISGSYSSENQNMPVIQAGR